MSIYSRIIGAGSYLPKKIVSNDDLSQFVDTSDEWIVKRTGIKQRHFVDVGETTAMLGERAALSAMQSANIDKNDIDLLILATSVPQSGQHLECDSTEATRNPFVALFLIADSTTQQQGRS